MKATTLDFGPKGSNPRKKGGGLFRYKSQSDSEITKLRFKRLFLSFKEEKTRGKSYRQVKKEFL